MFSHTSLTIRISGISPPGSITAESLEEGCREFCDDKSAKAHAKRLLRFLKSPKSPAQAQARPPPLLVSLARHGDSDTGVVTFPSEGSKTRALRGLGPAGTARTTGWRVDDTFADLTVLHSAPEPDVDICAIHGLNGNAFDTFAWEGRDMWLRDFLPQPQSLHPKLARLRVMTLGYSSLVRDSKNITGLDEWTLGLIQSVSAVRRSPSERTRPIIFVCHSLGGIVARQAMIRLEKFPTEGLKLDHCGLLFLATPHLGSEEANWNDFWLLTAKGAGVARGQVFTQLLHAFNRASVNAHEQFRALRPVPPVECLYETQRTSVAGTQREIVSPASAGLLERANPMQNVDHRTICKFPNAHSPGYLQVLDCLDAILTRLTSRPAPPNQHPNYSESLPPGGFRGGEAVGGNATSETAGGEAKGGSAAGGNVEVSSTFDTRGASVAGGTGRGGNAAGHSAVGGTGVGGTLRLG